MPTITVIETAIIDTLKSGLTYLKKAGPLSEFLKLKADTLVTVAPAIFVSYQAGNYSAGSMNVDIFDREMVFAVIIVTRNPVSQERLLHGDGSKVGVYDILEDVVATLKGQSLGLDIHPLQPLVEEALEGSLTTVVYGITFRTRCRV